MPEDFRAIDKTNERIAGANAPGWPGFEEGYDAGRDRGFNAGFVVGFIVSTLICIGGSWLGR